MTALLMGQLAAGGAHGIGFPRGLMMLARALVSLEGTAAIMAPGRDVATMLRSVLPGLVMAFLISGTRSPLPMFIGAALAGVATVISRVTTLWFAVLLGWLALLFTRAPATAA